MSFPRKHALMKMGAGIQSRRRRDFNSLRIVLDSPVNPALREGNDRNETFSVLSRSTHNAVTLSPAFSRNIVDLNNVPQYNNFLFLDLLFITAYLREILMSIDNDLQDSVDGNLLA